MTRGYLTITAIERAAANLSDRDRAIAADVARVRVLTGLQIRRLLFDDTDTGEHLCRRAMQRLADNRVMARLDRRQGGIRAGSDSYIYVLDVVGHYLSAPDSPRGRRPRDPGPTFLAHALDVAELYVRLREAEQARAIGLATFDAEPACWRSFTGAHGSAVALKPDAFAVTEQGEFEDHWFIEVDRSTEHRPQLVRKMQVYVRYFQSGKEQARSDVFPQVLWLVPDARRVAEVEGAIRRVDAEHRHLFAVRTFDEAVAVMANPDTLSSDGEQS